MSKEGQEALRQAMDIMGGYEGMLPAEAHERIREILNSAEVGYSVEYLNWNNKTPTNETLTRHCKFTERGKVLLITGEDIWQPNKN